MNMYLLSGDENLSTFPLTSCTKKIFNFYFTELKFINEKKHFLSNFKDDHLANSIRQLTELFHKYPFYNSLLLERAKNRKEINLFTKWQRQYYIDIFKEYNSLSDNDRHSIIELYNILQTNSSFQFLIKLFDDLNREIEGTDLTITLIKRFSYYNLKLKDPFQEKNKKELKEKLNLYTKLVNTGDSVRDLISIQEQNQIVKSINHLLSDYPCKGE